MCLTKLFLDTVEIAAFVALINAKWFSKENESVRRKDLYQIHVVSRNGSNQLIVYIGID